MKKLLLLACLALFATAYGGELAQLYAQQNKTEPAPAQDCPPPKEVEMPGVAPFPQKQGCNDVVRKPDPNISQIGLERTRCLASCPAYTVIINSDGTFRYTGEAFVERLGEYSGTVNQGMLNQVLYYIDRIDYLQLESSYASPFLDNATVYTMVVKDDETKVIQNYANSGPATLWALEQLIDDLLETASWDEGGGER